MGTDAQCNFQSVDQHGRRRDITSHSLTLAHTFTFSIYRFTKFRDNEKTTTTKKIEITSSALICPIQTKNYL